MKVAEKFCKEYKALLKSLDPEREYPTVGNVLKVSMDFTMDFVDKHPSLGEAFVKCKLNPLALYALCKSRTDGKSLKKRIEIINNLLPKGETE